MPIIQPEDEHLRALMVSGDRIEQAKALAVFAFGFLVRRCASLEDARRELLEVVRILLGSRRRWKEGESARTWALSVLRARLPQTPVGPREDIRGLSAEQLSEDQTVLARLRSWLDSLEPGAREALLLIAVEGVSLREASTILGEPSALVEQKANLAFAELVSALVGVQIAVAGACRATAEVLLLQAQGKLSRDELAELDAHANACPDCQQLLKTSKKAIALLEAYRKATDIEPDEAVLKSVLDELAARDEERSARVKKAQMSREEASRGTRLKIALGASIALVLIVVAAAAIKLTLFKVEPPAPNPILELLSDVTDQPSARDLACVLDIQLQEEWSRQVVRERRIATLVLSRWLARREGFADSVGFVKVLLSEHARTARLRSHGWIVFGAERADPLRPVGWLKQAGLHARAAEECGRIVNSTTDEPLRRRAMLQQASSLLLEGRLDEASSVLSAMEKTGSPGDLAGKLAVLVRERLDRARASRELLKAHVRPKPGESDYRGGELGVAALDRDFALKALAGAEQPILVGLLTSGWVKFLSGEFGPARVDFTTCFQKAQKRFTKSLAQLALAEIAFLEGRYLSGLGHLRLAQDYAPDTEGVSHFVSMLSLQQGLRELVELGSAPLADSFLKNTEQTPVLRSLIESAFAPRLPVLAASRDEVTKNWPQSDSPFHKVLGRTPGSVPGTDAIIVSFERGAGELTPAPGCELSQTEGSSGMALRVDSHTRTASVSMVLDLQEVETWVILAARPHGPGRFELRAKDADGRWYSWRTYSLVPGEWNRMAVPLGALEPDEPTGGDDSLIARRVGSLVFSFETWSETASHSRLDLDELIIRHGQKADQQGIDAPIAR